MIRIKSEEDLQMIRKSGQIAGRIVNKLRSYVKPGMTTLEIDQTALELMQKEKVISAFKGYKGFPANICTSINEEIVHGIPGQRKLEEGDILSIDIGINYKGFFSDMAVTLPVGKIDQRLSKLIEVSKTALLEGIKEARSENNLSDISHAIQSYVEKNGFSVVREFVGHGVGYELHEEPEIPNFGKPHLGPVLKSGMVFAIEPMVNMGGWEAEILDNGWTAVTKDGKPSAHFEHTIAITGKGPEILTN